MENPKSFAFQRTPQTEIRSRPLTPPSEAALQEWALRDKSRSQPYCLVLLTVLFFFLVIALSFHIGRTWDSQFSSSVLFLEEITEYCTIAFSNQLLGEENLLNVNGIAPILEDIPLIYTLAQFNDSTFHSHPAGSEIDGAWNALGINYRPIAVPIQLGAQSGLRRGQVKINSKYGGEFPAYVGGLLHLRCLNLLRQSLYFNFEYYRNEIEEEFGNDQSAFKMPVLRCLNILRQQLMCQVDIGLVGQAWDDSKAPKPHVDFKTQHKCRNFDDIRQWAEERQLPPVNHLPDDWLEIPENGDTTHGDMQQKRV